MPTAVAESVVQPPQDARLEIIIVGAGLAGISAAISCAAGGHSVTVIESAKELAEVTTFSFYKFILKA
jgi:2-polyprenyl-6-methoxyphenol hydroxylase-like FAD-dependent oxidoreductase